MSGSASDQAGYDSAPSSSRTAKSLGKAFSNFDIDGHDLPPSPAPSSPRTGKRYALATELVYTESTDQYNASSTPIYQVRRWKITSKNILPRPKSPQGTSRFESLLIHLHSLRRSNRHLGEEVENMTIQDLVILHEHTSNVTLRRSCAPSEPL